jgi:cytidylate kinase
MIITISGTPGSGKGTIGRLLAAELKYRFYSMGDIRRKYAAEHGMTIEQLNKKAEIDPTSDHLVDEYQTELGKKEDDVVIDSRLGFHFIPMSFKLFLDADEMVRVRRILNDKRATEHYKDADDAVQQLRERQESDKKRYKKLYDVDPYDVDAVDYGLLLDTSSNTPEELVAMILDVLNKLQYGK